MFTPVLRSSKTALGITNKRDMIVVVVQTTRATSSVIKTANVHLIKEIKPLAIDTYGVDSVVHSV